MSAGQLRHYAMLQTQSTVQDALGQPSTAWADVSPLWCDIRHTSGLEAIKSGADTSVVKVSIRVRHGAFSPAQRIAHEGQIYNIQSVLPDGKKEYINLVCEAVNVVS